MHHITDIVHELVIITIMNKQHKILATGLHAITINGRVYIFTEKEYQHLTWWELVKLKYFV